ncbi:MAG: putative sugar nucleotidyl transferase [Gemmatimonadota bacterium]
MKLYLFDDREARAFQPFAPTRPVGELLYGNATLRARSERVLGRACSGHWAGEEMVGFSEVGAPRGLRFSDLETPCLLLCSRVVLDTSSPEAWEPTPGLTPLEVGGRLAGWRVGPDTKVPAPASLADLEPAPSAGAPIQLRGGWIENPWSLMSGNVERLERDLAQGHVSPPSADPVGVHRMGSHALIVAPDVVIEPGVVFDTRHGPIHIEPGVELRAHLRLAGPAFVGRGSVLFGGTIGACSIGPVCKVRGEVEESVVLGYSNKAHDGFLGHAYLGRWVNLGAGTTNSDLKNNYGPVRVRLSDGVHDTGLTKVGCFLGDHVKTGIGTMLNTGTVVGAGSNLFGGTMPPTWVPPFSWGSGDALTEYRFDKFLEVARIVHVRRGLELSADMAEVLRRAWTTSAAQRSGAAT